MSCRVAASLLPLLWLHLCGAASEGGACGADGGCVCRRTEDCFTSVQPLELAAECCDDGLVCCPDYGISRMKCEHYAQLVSAPDGVPVCHALALPLIVGGEEALPAQVPHMAHVGYGEDGDGLWLCGGSLVSERWVLTAAHCVHNRLGPARRVRLGASLEGAEQEEDGALRGQVLEVVRRVVHPGYRPPARYHDVGLLLLSREPVLWHGVRPACLNHEFTIASTSAQACGYGSTAFDEENKYDVLRCVWIPLLKRKDCALHFTQDLGTSVLPKGLPRSILCATDLKGGKDTCKGDSGGPLHVLLESPFCTFLLVGVTSFGKFCGFPNAPGVYMRVSHYLPWIESIVWLDELREIMKGGPGLSPDQGYVPDDTWLAHHPLGLDMSSSDMAVLYGHPYQQKEIWRSQESVTVNSSTLVSTSESSTTTKDRI